MTGENVPAHRAGLCGYISLSKSHMINTIVIVNRKCAKKSDNVSPAGCTPDSGDLCIQ